jgi:hypothetical protein
MNVYTGFGYYPWENIALTNEKLNYSRLKYLSIFALVWQIVPGVVPFKHFQSFISKYYIVGENGFP